MHAEEIGIVLITHGGFALECLKSAEMIMGHQERIKAISVVEGMGLNETKKELNKAIDEIKGNGKVLVMTDIVGGTPSNAACILATSRNDIVVIAGFNMPMLLEVLSQRDKSLDEISTELCNIGKNGIVNLTEKMKNSLKI